MLELSSLEEPENLVDRNFMKVNKEKGKVLYLRWNKKPCASTWTGDHPAEQA